MSKAKDRDNRAARKDAMAAKYESLAKVAKSTPKRLTYEYKVKQYRMQAADIRREK